MDKFSERFYKDKIDFKTKLSEGINMLKDYFTLEGNKIKCDYCSNSYDIILNTEEVRNHVSQHKVYENAVSSKSSQEDLEEFYITKNNFIECVCCNEKLCDPWNARSIIHYHLREGHKFNDGATRLLWLWLCENYTLDESDATVEQWCKKCNVKIENKPKYLIEHLRDGHNDDRGSAFTPNKTPQGNSLDNSLQHWTWDYFTKYEENARCFLCSSNFQYYHSSIYNQIKSHINDNHEKDKQDLTKSYYTEIQEHLVKCDFCEEEFDIPFFLYLKRHLKDVHGLEYDKSIDDNLSKYRSTYFKKLGFQKLQCNKCNEVLRETCSLKLTIHLKTCQNINIDPVICSLRKSSSSPRKSSSSPRKSSSSLGSKKNVKDIPTSSGHPKAGSSKDSDTGVRDVDHDRDSRKDLKRKSSDPSNPKPGCSHDFPDISDDDDRNSGMKRVKYDDVKGSSDESSSSSSSFLKPHKDAGNIAINVPTNVGSTEETNESTLSTETIPNIGEELVDMVDLGNIDFNNLNQTIGNINRETDQSPHSPNE